eukprot:GHVU01058869.1.p1 GENE.GHVU01058869.1~~GHVU01058869.1.p1  ORF type:complete len:512 (+),score=54.72 GHVU01058869.1:151-1536(+)
MPFHFNKEKDDGDDIPDRHDLEPEFDPESSANISQLIRKQMDKVIAKHSHISSEFLEQLDAIYFEFADVFRLRLLFNDGPIKCRPMIVTMKENALPTKCYPRRYGPVLDSAMLVYFNSLLELNWAVLNPLAVWASAPVVVKRKEIENEAANPQSAHKAIEKVNSTVQSFCIEWEQPWLPESTTPTLWSIKNETNAIYEYSFDDLNKLEFIESTPLTAPTDLVRETTLDHPWVSTGCPCSWFKNKENTNCDNSIVYIINLSQYNFAQLIEMNDDTGEPAQPPSVSTLEGQHESVPPAADEAADNVIVHPALAPGEINDAVPSVSAPADSPGLTGNFDVDFADTIELNGVNVPRSLNESDRLLFIAIVNGRAHDSADFDRLFGQISYPPSQFRVPWEPSHNPEEDIERQPRRETTTIEGGTGHYSPTGTHQQPPPASSSSTVPPPLSHTAFLRPMIVPPGDMH